MKNTSKLWPAALSALLLMAGCSTAETPAATAEPAVEPTPEATAPASEEIVSHAPDLEALKASGAPLSQATVYGIYQQQGDAVDSSIQCTVVVNTETGGVVSIELEEALLPVSAGGAEGWAVLDEQTAQLLGDHVVTQDEMTVPAEFELNGIRWYAQSTDEGIDYQADIQGETVSLMSYIQTQEGGQWYHESLSTPASLLDADGEEVAQVQIETKASIRHGEDFWPSAITFPGNITLIENVVYDYGIQYDRYPESSDIAKNEDGQWVVADVNSGATLAGAPNYWNLIKDAADQIAEGNGTEVTE